MIVYGWGSYSPVRLVEAEASEQISCTTAKQYQDRLSPLRLEHSILLMG